MKSTNKPPGSGLCNYPEQVGYCIFAAKTGCEINEKQTLFVNTWKHSQACSWETEKTLRLSSRYSQTLAR